MNGLIQIPDFVAYLKQEGLVLVRASELEEGKHLKQRELRHRLMKRRAISFAEVIEGGFFRLSSVQGLYHWHNAGKFEKGEAYQLKNNRWMLLTSAIKRLGYAD